MVLYHEVERDKLGSVLANGLSQGSGGGKRDKAINKTDKFLNSFRSKELISLGVDRQTNIYCYMAEDGKVADITSGMRKSPDNISQDPGYILLKVTPRPGGGFVSDLDTYDGVKECLLQGDTAGAHKLAAAYWKRLVPLEEYDGSYHRPEVMLAYDVGPEDIAVADT